MEVKDNNITGSSRDLTFDIVRTICILEIVGFWHLQDYRNPVLYTRYIDFYGGVLTQGVLATFTLMSSIFLGRSSVHSIYEVGRFWVKRLKRFFPLFFLSSILLYVASSIVGECWYTGFNNFVLSLVGLTNFLPPQPATMWYMSMLIFLYFITPIVISVNNRYIRFFLALTLFVIVIIIGEISYVDSRLLLYMPLYLIGLVLPKGFWAFIKKNLLCLIVSATVTIIDILKGEWLLDSNHYIILISMPLFLISISSYFEHNKIIATVCSKISYSSMNIYLFHRHFFLLFVFLFGFSETPSLRDAYLPTWELYFVILPIIVISSFLLQRIYDKLLERLNKN